MHSERPQQDLANSELRSFELGLVDQLLGGSNLAWEQFVERYAMIVRSRVERVSTACGLRTDASNLDDLTAEIFSALLGNDSAPLRAFQGRSSLATYLSVIAARVTIRRSVSNRMNVEDRELHELVDEHHESPPQQAISSEEKAQLARLIELLPHRQREMIRMFYYDELSYREISKRLQVPIGSIGPTLKRAEQRLRETIEKP